MDHALKGGSMDKFYTVHELAMNHQKNMYDLEQDLKEARQLYKDAKARITQLEEQNRWLAQNFNKYAREFDRIFSENAVFNFKSHV